MGAAAVVGVLVAAVVLAALVAVVREVRADGQRRRPVRDEDDWGDQGAPSLPHARARW